MPKRADAARAQHSEKPAANASLVTLDLRRNLGSWFVVLGSRFSVLSSGSWFGVRSSRSAFVGSLPPPGGRMDSRGTWNQEPGTGNPEPGTEHEPRTPEPGTVNEEHAWTLASLHS